MYNLSKKIKTRTRVVRSGPMDSDGAGGCVWAVFPARYSDERIHAFLARHSRWADFIYDRLGQWSPHMCDEYYYGPGQPYSHGYYLHRKGSRVLARQDFGYDI